MKVLSAGQNSCLQQYESRLPQNKQRPFLHFTSNLCLQPLSSQWVNPKVKQTASKQSWRGSHTACRLMKQCNGCIVQPTLKRKSNSELMVKVEKTFHLLLNVQKQ